MPLTQQAKEFLNAIALSDPPQWQDMSPEEGRERFNSFTDLFGQGPEIAHVEDRTLPGDIDVRVYANSDEIQPAVMYFHGGGWVLGNLETHDALCRRIAKDSECTIIAVDYALSPEHRYPKALEDCYNATKYVKKHGREFRINPRRLAVAGDSAGGNLAAAVALKARDENGPKIRHQILIYPVIEPNFDTESYQSLGTGHGLSRDTMQWFWEQYLGDQTADQYAAPGTADSLAGLPPAHVFIAEYDVLRDECESYAERINEAGGSASTSMYLGNLHGFIHFAGLFEDGIAATNKIVDVLRFTLVK
jgi:acetyl esterase